MSLGWDCFWTSATSGSTVHPPDDIWVSRAMVEWYWQAKRKNSEKKPVQVPLFSSHIPRALSQGRNRASTVRGQRLTAWVMERPKKSNYCWIKLHARHRLATRTRPFLGTQFIWYFSVRCKGIILLDFKHINCNKLGFRVTVSMTQVDTWCNQASRQKHNTGVKLRR
jgi:hypothetical protein